MNLFTRRIRTGSATQPRDHGANSRSRTCFALKQPALNRARTAGELLAGNVSQEDVEEVSKGEFKSFTYEEGAWEVYKPLPHTGDIEESNLSNVLPRHACDRYTNVPWRLLRDLNPSPSADNGKCYQIHQRAMVSLGGIEPPSKRFTAAGTQKPVRREESTSWVRTTDIQVMSLAL